MIECKGDQYAVEVLSGPHPEQLQIVTVDTADSTDIMFKSSVAGSYELAMRYISLSPMLSAL